jgi:hypothetical protein
MKLYLFPFLAMILVVLAACDTNATAQPQPYPSSTTVAAPVPTVTADPTLGTVVGVLQQKQDGNPQPTANALLYLAELKKDSTGREVGAGYDRTTAPRAVTDAQGRFLFSNVPIGHYALVLDRINNSYMLNKPSDGSDMLIMVAPGQTVDLGTLAYDQLPKP